MNSKKLESIKNWAVPNSSTEIRKFLGFTGYYRYFIPNYSQIAWPLLHLTKKTTPWEWTKMQQLAFDLLKSTKVRGTSPNPTQFREEILPSS